jgi:hypothetical protein
MGRADFFRLVTIIVLPCSIISCGEPRSIELSVDGASLTRNYSGRAAIDVSLSAESARDYAIFTSKVYGRLIEVRFRGETLTRARLTSPIAGGHFQMGASPDRADGTLDEDNAAEIASKLSLGLSITHIFSSQSGAQCDVGEAG